MIERNIAPLLTGFYPRIHDRGFERFVRLCAGRTGQLLNLSNLANDAGVSHATARAWIGLSSSRP